MVLLPSRTRFRKQQKQSTAGCSKGGVFVAFGDYGMQALGRGWISGRQIEAARRAMTRDLGRRAKVWIRAFPDKPVTKKPAETRMGKGKGGVDHWVAVIRPGRILFEVANVSLEEARRALAKASGKLPIRTRFVGRLEHV